MNARIALVAMLVPIALSAQAQPPTKTAPAPARAAAPVRASAPERYGLGRAATPDDIRKLDIDVMPDGRGLPPGRGTVAEGVAVYAAKCARCHGDKGQGGSADRLVGKDPSVKTIGNYWPYATTVYDYTLRAMPFNQPGTLTPNEVYAVTAYLLHLNEIVAENAVMDQTTLPQVKMPARDKFVKDDRTGGKIVK